MKKVFFGFLLIAAMTMGFLFFWQYKNIREDFRKQAPEETKIDSGAYVVYSVTKIFKSATDSEPAETSTELYSYRLEDNKTNKLFSSSDPFIFSRQGIMIGAVNALSSSSAITLLDLNGQEIQSDRSDLPTFSDNGRFEVLTSAFNKKINDFGCGSYGLEINISKSDGTDLVKDKIFVWEDHGLHQLCPEKYYVSNDGKYFYVIGDLMGSGVSDTLVKYSVEKDELVKIEIGKNSWLGAWQLKAGDGWFGGVTYGYNREPQETIKINLLSGEVTVLTEPNSKIEEVFLSADGKAWSPVFGDGVGDEEIKKCVRVLSEFEVLSAKDDSQCLLDGKVLDWQDDILVVEQDGELMLYNIKTKETTTLVEKSEDINYQSFEYIGTIKI